MRPIIQFESTIENNLIRIPKQYMGQTPARVMVTLMDAGDLSSFECDKASIRDIEAASTSSMSFWDNQYDEVWENV